jgi:signal transduction histidine kinase
MDSGEQLELLRQELRIRLEQPHLNYDDILRLSSELARFDKDHVRFTVDAAHISRLGKELVARQETAVSELVKNAYDADSTRVELSFQNTEVIGGTLVIDDDGTGMDQSQLINGFMRLSSTDKIHNPISPLYRRSRAGRKGIGRFAAQRLGTKLTIITQTATSNTALHIEIDWERFQKDQDLGIISSRIQEMPKQKEQGTTLIIEGLAEVWSLASITRVYRYIIDLTQPFPLSKKQTKSSFDPGFEVVIYQSSGQYKDKVASIEIMVYEHALAEIEGFVDDNNRGYWSIKSEHLAIDEKILPIGKERESHNSPFNQLKDVYFKAYYYIYDRGYIPRTYNKLIRELAYERGGIRIYRNGFRVLPYGEILDDWLALDDSSARREILPPHANINFLGFVEIIDPDGLLFEETASREGLIENEAFRELVEFVSRTLKAAVIRIGEARNKKTTPNRGSKKQKQLSTSPADEINKAAQALQQVAAELNNQLAEASTGVGTTPEVAEQFRDRISNVQQIAENIQDISKEVVEENGMLRILASLGLVIGEFTHEIRHQLTASLLDADYFLKLSGPTDNHKQVADRLIKNLSNFSDYTAYFDKAVSENVRREIEPQELSIVLRRFYNVIKYQSEKYAIVIQEPKIYGYDLFTCPMHSSEWASILFNLFSNARKAIKRANVHGKILMQAGRIGNKVYVEFADNGDGIAPEHEDRIFDAFFTTTTPSSPFDSNQDDISGTGLGLKIVNDIISSYKGEIFLIDPPSTFSTCFRIELPAILEEERDKYGL